MKVIGRSAGRSAVAAAAYRAGESLHDERTQTTHDYTRRSGVEAAFIVAPAHAPEWAKDTGKLWNAAEAAERKSNSQLAREWELALPAAVGAKGREAIAREFAAHLVERYGVAVGVALHEPSRHGDDRNYHAHILTTTRRMGADGLGEKTRELVDKKTGAVEISHIREYAAALINAALADSGSGERIDHRSFKDRGIEQLPTQHLGVEAAAMERRGKPSGRGDLNREIEQANQTLGALTEERGELDRQIVEASQPPPEPQQGGEDTHWQDRIAAEMEGEGGSEGGATAPITATESQTANSSIHDPVNASFARQIATHGEIQHKGLVKSWVEHALEWAHELGEDLADAWEVFKGGDPDLPDLPEPAEDTPADPELATHKNFWQRFVGRKNAAPAEEKPLSESKSSEAPSGNRFQQLTKGVKRESASPTIELRGKGADYWRKVREGENLTESNKPSNEIDHDRDNEPDIER